MKCVVLFYGLLSLASAAVVPDETQAKIVKYENINDGTGNYKFSYETSNGIFRDEIGYLVNVGKEDEHMVVEGSYSYTDAEGKRVFVKYIADQNGFQTITPQAIPQVTYSLPPNVVASLLGK